MSSRAVKKLLRERGYDDLAETTARIERRAQQLQENNSDGDSGSDGESAANSTPVNPFDLLNDGAESEEDEDDKDQEEQEDDELVQPEEPVAIEKPSAKQPAKKKGKKGKKSKSKGKKPAAKDMADMSIEEFEAQLAAIGTTLPDAHASGSNSDTGGRKHQGVSGVGLTEEQQKNPRHLDAEAEIKRLFGSVAVHDAGKRKVPQSRLPRRLALSHPKMAWPPMRTDPGVEMEVLEHETADDEMKEIMDKDRTGGMWFGITHSPRFRTIQLEFLSCVMTHNADGVAALVYQHPYHVDALLQLSEIIKQTGGDFGEAAELVERALYAFEVGFATKFSATNGLCRLDFRRIESRSLFLAVFRNMQFMARRGCWRTVFEFNKVLLSLDPERDPLGAMLTLDFHALKAKQFEYVRSFVSDWTLSPVELPNWAYSRALAEFMYENSRAGKSAATQGSGTKKSLDMLVSAILWFPTVVPLLWSKANIDVDPVVLTHPYFQEMTVPDESAMTYMQLMVTLFVERNFPLYRTPEVTRWLQEGLLLALSRIANDASLASSGKEWYGDAAKYETIRRKFGTYVVPENICRHVLVADMESLKSALPENIRNMETFAFDPLPPTNNINIYNEILGDRGMGGAVMPGGLNVEDLEEEDMGVFEMLIGRLRRQILGDRAAGLAEDPGTSDEEDFVGALGLENEEELLDALVMADAVDQNDRNEDGAPDAQGDEPAQ
ncbi:hypothetical protein FBU59_002410 [Linderina macrospora]|uniref:Uncharacterized protein n=1 Tax=Linderina macrospora TaxID=4868 RepID=A0ACC1JB86_9FUNG|nr:hypothetical protein FBU59_002410 [Linderina macrospora]